MAAELSDFERERERESARERATECATFDLMEAAPHLSF
jgi:hypothetical protein